MREPDRATKFLVRWTIFFSVLVIPLSILIVALGHPVKGAYGIAVGVFGLAGLRWILKSAERRRAERSPGNE